MGNQISCNNYYCHPVSFKPEWLSHSNYIFHKDKTNFKIEKGILEIEPSDKVELLFYKKLDLDSSTPHEFQIPFHFQFHSSFPLSFYIFITSNFHFNTISSLQSFLSNKSKNINNNIFYIKCNLYNQHNFEITYSHFEQIFQGVTSDFSSKHLLQLSFQQNDKDNILVSHSFESSSKSISSHSFHFPFSLDNSYLTFYIESNYPFLSTQSFSCFLE